MQKAKQMASQMKKPADVWKLERYLTQRRNGIDRSYEFRFFSPDASVRDALVRTSNY